MNIKKTVLWTVVGAVVLAGLLWSMNVWGATPAEYGLTEGNTISAANSSDPDIYIVNEQGYKRLFLNPVIFGFYGHLGGFANVKNVTPETRDAFITSGLFRVDGSEKVYGLETTGEDTATLHWVNTTGAQAAVDDANFFKKVFVINQNEFNWYTKGSDYTSVNQIPAYSRAGGAAPTVPVQVNKAVLSIGNPQSETITKNASGFEMLIANFEGNGSVNSLTVKRLGFGDREDYDGIYLVKNGVRLTDLKGFNSDNVVVFGGLSLQAPFTLSVVADFSGIDNAQNIAKVELQGDYIGLPLQSNNLTFAGATSGEVSIVDSGSDDIVVVGQKNAKVGEFRVAAGVEDITLQKLYLYNAGTADISNVKLTVEGTTYISSLTGDKYLFNLSTVIKSDRSKKFEVFADIDSDAREPQYVKIILEEDYDVVALGNVYGFGLTVDNGLTTDNSNRYNVDISGSFAVDVDTDTDPFVLSFSKDKQQILAFSVEPEDEDFNLTDVVIGGLNKDLVKNVYVYKGDTLLGSESVDNPVATVSFDFVVNDETDFMVKADITTLSEFDQDEVDDPVEAKFTPSLVKVVGTGVGSDKELPVAGEVGNEVYVYSAKVELARTDDLGVSEDLLSGFEQEVLTFSVKAIDGDVQLEKDSVITFAMAQRGLDLITPANPGSLAIDGQDAIPETYKLVCPEGYEVNPISTVPADACFAWIMKVGAVPAHYVYTAKISVVDTPAVPAVAPIAAVPATPAIYASADYRLELDGDIIAEGSFTNGDIELPLVLSDDVEITKNSTKEFVLTVDFNNFKDENSRFSLELKDTTGAIVWQVEDVDGELVNVTSVADTIVDLPLKSARFAN